jgi:hypothetical protein
MGSSGVALHKTFELQWQRIKVWNSKLLKSLDVQSLAYLP